MPIGNKKNLYLDRPSKSRGYMSGNDVTWFGEDTSEHIYKWLRDMGMVEEPSENLIREVVRSLLLEREEYYFAYGSNTHPDEMKRKGVDFTDRGIAKLGGYNLRYAGESSEDSTGRADIYPDDKVLKGRLYTMEDLESLDSHEAMYDRVKVTVDKDGSPIEAYTYVMKSDADDNDPSDEYLDRVQKGRATLSECIIAGGHLDGSYVMVKNRDRNYSPELTIVRELAPCGLEMVYMADASTGYLEGMNSAGIAVINSSLLVIADEQEGPGPGPIKKDGPSDALVTGQKIKKALESADIEKAVKVVSTVHLPSTGRMEATPGVKGHTFIGSPQGIYSLELTSGGAEGGNPIIKKLDSMQGFDVRTNHGIDLAYAGYDPRKRPNDYVSSRIRKATAEVQLAGCRKFEELGPAISKQDFKDPNFNMMRRTDNLSTTSQIALDLNRLVFCFYLFPGFCNFAGVIDLTPEGYEPKIDIQIKKY